MEEIRATVPVRNVPEWAVLQRELLDAMSEAIQLVLDEYTLDDGKILWPWPPDGDHEIIDGVDDAYESFWNWPLLYVLGGDDNVLEASIREWEAITEQFSEYDTGKGHPTLIKEYDQGRDWFHQGEGNLLLYNICLAAPDNEKFRERARRFAGFYIGDDPEIDIYDEEKHLIKAPETGSAGTVENWPDDYSRGATDFYGLPFQDIEGVDSMDDLNDPEKADRMGQAMKQRMETGDVPMNLAATSLVTTAYLLTGDEKYREWVTEYVEAWIERTEENDGIIPDNIGLSGEIGEYIDGKWYGGFEGWTWHHGWRGMGEAIVAAGENATLLTGDTTYLDLPRSQIDVLADNGIHRDGTLYVPHKYGDEGWYDYKVWIEDVLKASDGSVLWRDGWFEFYPLDGKYSMHLWINSGQAEDGERIERHHHRAREEAQQIRDRYFGAGGKADQGAMGGHEDPWYEFLQGNYPAYPNDILTYNYRQFYDQLARIRNDTEPKEEYGDSYLQQRNPVRIEGLSQLTVGAPYQIYNGGLFMSIIRHFDPERNRPGLPRDIAAMVTAIERDRVRFEIVNIGSSERELITQAGAYGEHDFGTASYNSIDESPHDSPHDRLNYDVTEEDRVVDVEDNLLSIAIAGGSHLAIEAELTRNINDPTLSHPWDPEPVGNGV